MYQDDCRLKGVVNLVLRDKDGKVKQHKTIRNKVTRAGIAHIIGRMIDDGQDRAGKHKMPRMMSHMAIGIGAAARNGPNDYTATDFNALPATPLADKKGQNQSSSTALVTTRKRAADATSYDRMLQDERGFRVQLMKDTTLATDYVPLTGVVLTKDGSSNYHSLTSDGKSQLTFQTGSTTSGVKTIDKLRVGLQVTKINIDAAGAVTIPGTALKIEKIDTPSLISGALTTSTTITLDGALPTSPSNLQPGASSSTCALDVEYVDRVGLTAYSTNAAMPNHPTLTNHKSVFEPKSGSPNEMGPFGAANARASASIAASALSESSNTAVLHTGPITVGTSRDGTTYIGPYTEEGIGMLGITRGRIGAFYEREMEYNIKLIHTDSDGIASSSVANTQDPQHTKVDEPSYAVLDYDTTGNVIVARFPFLGSAETKPTGVTGVNTPGDSLHDQAGYNTVSAGGARGTEFVQFGTSVDGIFQGELIGSSITADDGDNLPEGYPPTENDYKTLGGLTSNLPSTQDGSNEGAEELAVYNTASGNAFVAYNWALSSYAPNAVQGSKKNGDRIVYVATFKENNPRPELDYRQINATQSGAVIAPTNRVYPITEAGIFNKHKKDLGIFDVGNRSYTDDTTLTEIAHIDSRLGITNSTAHTSGTEIDLNTTSKANTAAGGTSHTDHSPVEGVLTPGGKSITASAYGFTQYELTQTMLCRTTFDPVNKATADTLQITWSVQLQDNTQ